MFCLSRFLCTESGGSVRCQNLLTFVETVSLSGLTQVNMRPNSRVYQAPDLLSTVLIA
jgi:hypothetical protein